MTLLRNFFTGEVDRFCPRLSISLIVEDEDVHEAASYRLRIEEEDGRWIHGEGSPGVKIGSRGFGGETCAAREGDSGTNIVVMKLAMFLLSM